MKYRLPHGSDMVFPDGDAVARFLLEGWYEYAEIAFFYQVLRAGDRVLDIGAHAGLYSTIAKKCVGRTGTVIAVDPNPDIRDCLAANLTDRVVASVDDLPPKAHAVLTLAVSDRDHVQATLSKPASARSAYASLLGDMEEDDGRAERLAVTTTTVDAIARAVGEGFTLIKVDVEGFEPAVLRGARETLAGADETLVMLEFTEENLTRKGLSWRDLAREVTASGLRLYAFNPDRRRLDPVHPDQPYWHANLLATRDAGWVNTRLAEAAEDRVAIAGEVIARGRAAAHLYDRSLTLNAAARDYEAVLGDLADITATLLAEPAREPEPVSVAGPDGDAQFDRALARAMIDTEVGRLKGIAAAIAEELRATRARLHDATVPLVERVRELETALHGRPTLPDAISNLFSREVAALSEAAGRVAIGEVESRLARHEAARANAEAGALRRAVDEAIARATEQTREAASARAERDAARLEAERAEADLQATLRTGDALRASIIALRQTLSEKDAQILGHDEKIEEAAQAINALQRALDAAEEALEQERAARENLIAERLAEAEAETEARWGEDQQRELEARLADLADQHRAEIEALEQRLENADAQRAISAESGFDKADIALQWEAVSKAREQFMRAQGELVKLTDETRAARRSRWVQAGRRIGTGPDTTLASVLAREDEVRSALSEIDRHIQVLVAASSEARRRAGLKSRSDLNGYDLDAMWAAAEQLAGEARREHLRANAGQDLAAIGDIALQMQRSRLIRLARALNLPVAQRLDALVNVYTARQG